MRSRKWFLPIFISAVCVSVAAAQTPADQAQQRLVKEVRHELVMLPFYNLFDNLSFRVDGGKVTLMGQVTRPILKSDAEGVVKQIPGVQSVDNQIEVLPLSANDDQLRFALYRAIYSQAPLQTLSIRAVPPIHIIVKNGDVTLEGVVATQLEKDVAGIAANGVSGVFSVTNNLRVEP